jgi:hypothetical protein
MVVAVALAIGSELVNMCWKAEPVIYKFCFRSILCFILHLIQSSDGLEYCSLSRTEFSSTPKLQWPQLLNRWSDEDVFILSGKVSKLSITLLLCIFPDSAPCSVSRVLWDRRQSKSESVIKVPPLVNGVPTIITSSLFIGFEHMSNEWKVGKWTTSLIL